MATTSPRNLELRTIPIPSESVVEFIGHELEQCLRNSQRHYLAGELIRSGDILEFYRDGEWIEGRYQWTGNPSDEPTIHTNHAVFWLHCASLLRRIP